MSTSMYALYVPVVRCGAWAQAQCIQRTGEAVKDEQQSKAGDAGRPKVALCVTLRKKPY